MLFSMEALLVRLTNKLRSLPADKKAGLIAEPESILDEHAFNPEIHMAKAPFVPEPNTAR
jgi:hypothetical protein